jgi:hypothetical protein
MLIEESVRISTKFVTHSSAAAFVAKAATRVAIREPMRRARKDAMKSRQQKQQPPPQLGHH